MGTSSRDDGRTCVAGGQGNDAGNPAAPSDDEHRLILKWSSHEIVLSRKWRFFSEVGAVARVASYCRLSLVGGYQCHSQRVWLEGTVTRIFVGGEWRRSTAGGKIDVHDPSREESIGSVPAGGASDVDLAVAAAVEAFDEWSRSSREERLSVLRRILEQYEKRVDELAEVVSLEMGAPITLAREAQAPVGARHLEMAIKILEEFEFETDQGNTRLVREPIGVCGLITPWNWPLNQILSKVAPAIAAGCTMVLKPSEVAPFNAVLFTEVIEDAGVPAGVFNLVHGRGPEAGAALASHPKVDLMSFTGSTRGGVSVAVNAAPTVKRVSQELGGKSPNIILDDADLEQAVRDGVAGCYVNSGQSCNALTRMLVPRRGRRRRVASPPNRPLRSKRVTPVTPPPGLAPSLVKLSSIGCRVLSRRDLLREREYFAGAWAGPKTSSGDGTCARQSLPGSTTTWPSLGPRSSGPSCRSSLTRTKIRQSKLPTTPSTAWPRRSPRATRRGAKRLAGRLRAGQVRVNNASAPPGIPFGGYKQSGNGREQGEMGMQDYLETKAIIGFSA